MISLKDKLIEKSQEAFIMSIEIYNKPTIKYRVEGFSFFICNAWELMLKAHMINKFGDNSIYFKDNPKRTLSIDSCIKEIFTNDKDPLRLNLEKIIELRNTSTHLITEEYEMVYIPLFQACLFNFVETMHEFHGFDMTSVVPQNFLTLSVSMKSLKESEVRAKYPEEIATKIIEQNLSLSSTINENSNEFAIKVEHYHFITKDKNKATSFVGIDKESESKVKIIKELKNPNDTHKYTAKACIAQINNRLAKEKINVTLNTYHFPLFCKYYSIKENEKLCYVHRVLTFPSYSYSMQAIDFIFEEIKKDPDNIIQNLKDRVKNKEKS